MVSCVHRKYCDPNTPLGELIKQEGVWAKVVAFFLQALQPGEQNKTNRLLFVSKDCQRAVADFTKSHPEKAASWRLKLWQVTLYFQWGYGPAPASTVEIYIRERHHAGFNYYREELNCREIGITVFLPRHVHGDATVPGGSEIREISNAIGVANDHPGYVFGQDSTDEVTFFLADMCKLSEKHGKQRVTIEFIE
jgi:hypothetical protein